MHWKRNRKKLWTPQMFLWKKETKNEEKYRQKKIKSLFRPWWRSERNRMKNNEWVEEWIIRSRMFSEKIYYEKNNKRIMKTKVGKKMKQR